MLRLPGRGCEQRQVVVHGMTGVALGYVGIDRI
jgi:hypothetical protein